MDCHTEWEFVQRSIYLRDLFFPDAKPAFPICLSWGWCSTLRYVFHTCGTRIVGTRPCSVLTNHWRDELGLQENAAKLQWKYMYLTKWKHFFLVTGNVSSTYVWNEFPHCFITYAGLPKLRQPWVYCANQKTGNTLIWFWQIICILANYTEGRDMRGSLKTTDLLSCCLRFGFFWHLIGFFLATHRSTNILVFTFFWVHSNHQIKSDRFKCFQHLNQNVFKWDSKYKAVLKLIASWLNC